MLFCDISDIYETVHQLSDAGTEQHATGLQALGLFFSLKYLRRMHSCAVATQVSGCSLTSNTNAVLPVLCCGYLLTQAIFQALQLYSWGFATIKIYRNTGFELFGTSLATLMQIQSCLIGKVEPGIQKVTN